MILQSRMWLDGTRSKAVPDGSPEAAYLLGIAGDWIPEAEARRVGLLDVPPEAETTAGEPPETAQVDTVEHTGASMPPEARRGPGGRFVRQPPE